MNDQKRASEIGPARRALEPRGRPRLRSPSPGYDDTCLDLRCAVGSDGPGRPPQCPRQAGGGLAGIKSAVRGDSSFFAHCYRGTLIAITAALLGIDQRGWCLLVIGACLVLIAELAHSAVDTLARAIGDPEEPRLKTAREIAAGGVLGRRRRLRSRHRDRPLLEIRRVALRRRTNLVAFRTVMHLSIGVVPGGADRR